MATIKFIYKGEPLDMQCSEEDIMENIYEKFAKKIKLKNLSKLYFLYSGNTINSQLTLSQVINDFDRERKMMSILVFDTDEIPKGPKIIKSVFPICKECNETMLFNIEDYKIVCSGCKNGHSIKMLINEYEDYQNIDLTKIKCDICQNDKYNIYNNELYLCNTCKKKICPLCKSNHDKNHNIIDYDLKCYICIEHKESYISFCKSCGINICFSCQNEHINHDIILYGDILPNKNRLNDTLNDYKNEINKFNNDIEQIINKLLNIKEQTENLYKIYYDMVNKFEDKFRNYEEK